MALPYTSFNPDQLAGTSAARLTHVRPHPSEEGVFIIQRGETLSTVKQKYVQIGGATIKYTLEKPEVEVDPTPIVLVPGYGGIKPAYRELRKSVVQNGRPAVTFKPPRTQERLAALHPRHALHPERLLAQSAIAIAKDLIKNENDDEFEKVDAVGHSMGGPAVMNGAKVKPNLFRTTVAMASAGLDGHTLHHLAWRMPKAVGGELVPSIRDVRVRRDYRSVRDIVHYVARNPWRTMAEGFAVGSGDIRDTVTMVGSLGIHTAALQFPNDRFFPEAGVREKAADRFELYRVFPDPEANHMWPQLQPEAVGNEIVDIITSVTK